LKRILVVDDSPSIRYIIKTMINELGTYDINDAPNGETALRKLRLLPYDLVISDWNMPRMSGIELLGEMRKDDALKKIPVIMVTAEATKDNVETAAALGINGYITKPFTPAKMDALLKTLL
jgi:two-component system, chemotaxis family, chemotaxis protein CheY